MAGIGVKEVVDGRGGSVAILGRHSVVDDHVAVLIPEGQFLGRQSRHIAKRAGSGADRLARKSLAQARQPRLLDDHAGATRREPEEPVQRR